ncbi:hypothetical protein FXS38_21080 [Salmonella enterica]|nr:hypothetical protein [Salmonella enterica]ECO8823625.1 hypothetical protein [Salmonella enterica subsp. enterica serovar Typhimurium]
MFHTIVSIKNDGHYFCRAGGNRPDGLNEPVTRIMTPTRFKHLRRVDKNRFSQRDFPPYIRLNHRM